MSGYNYTQGKLDMLAYRKALGKVCHKFIGDSIPALRPQFPAASEPITREFALGKSLGWRFAKEAFKALGTLNSKKIGRNRRGSMLLTGTKIDGKNLVVTWQAVPGHKAGRIKPGKFCIYPYADHGKLLKAAKA